MISIGWVYSVKCAAMTFADVLGYFVIIISIIRINHLLGKLNAIGACSIQVSAQDNDNQYDLEPRKKTVFFITPPIQ